MSIDLDKHKNAIQAAFNDVVNDKTQTNWALFGYEGQSNVLKVIGTGEDGVEEMAEDLNSSKIMYASLRVVDPNTTRPKVVLINWQGEGAPTLRKGTCARHLNDVNKFLRGVHVTVNARTEEEVEPDVIMAAVLKASATTYNFNERSEINEKTTPVKGLVDTFKRGEASGAAQKPWGPGVTCGEGSYTYPSKMPKPKTKSDMGTNYKRTNPLAEINTKSRNRFWEEQEVEERRRKTEEQTKRDEELKLLESERKQREIDDAKHREVLTKERNARILAERKAEEEAAKRLAAQDEKKWQHDLHNQYEEEQERARRAEMMRMERKKEAESLIGQRMHSTRAMFESASSTSEQNAELNRPPPRKLKEFKPAIDVERTETTEQTANVLPNRGVTARWPPANNTAQKEDTSLNRNKVSDNSIIQNRVKTSPVPSIPKEHNVSEPPKSVSQPPVSQPPVSQPPVSQPPVSQPPVSQQPPSPREVEPVDVVPRQQPHQPQLVQQQQHASSQPHSNGDLSSNGFNDAVVPNKMSPQSHMENGQVGNTTTDAFNGGDDSYVTTIDMSNSASKETVTNSAANPTIGMVYEVDGMEYQILPEHGLCARALYDYQSADSTEITFDPEEIITNIDQIDPGWWQGVGPDGSFGLFPANYVELINSTGV